MAEVEVVPFDERQSQIARQAYVDFGRGSGHPAQLNFGDTFAYSLHRVTGEPILFKGEDFAAAGVNEPAHHGGGAGPDRSDCGRVGE